MTISRFSLSKSLVILPTLLSLAAALFLAVPSGCAAQESGLTGRLKTEYFTVHYDPEDPYLAKLMADTAREELMSISERLGYEPPKGRPFTLRIYRNHRDFIRAGGLEERRFVVGTTRLGDESIAVDASGAFVTAREVLAHEITHAVIFRLLGIRSLQAPLWFHEGAAKYFSSDSVTDDEILLTASATQGTLFPLNDLTEKFPSGGEPLAYAQSYSAMRYLVREHGESAPREVLQALASGLSFDEALENAAGMDSTEFVSAWHASVSDRSRVVRLTAILGAAGGLLMSILAVIAFITRRKRMREAAREWEQEEFEEALRRQLGNDWSN